MEIQYVSNSKNIPVTQLVRAKYAPGKLSLPVKQSQFLYSNLKHITGIPASQQQGGYSLTKLKALDNMIDLLGRLGKQPEPVSVQKVSDPNQLTSIINRVADNLHQMAQQASPYSNIGVETGLLVNFTV